MKLITKILAPVLLSVLVVGCGGSDKNTTDTLQPKDIPAYIANFKKQFNELKLTLDNKDSKLSLIEELKEEERLLLRIDSGIAVVGFDYKKNAPTKFLEIYEGNSDDIDNLLDNPDRVLIGESIEITETDSNFILTGSVIDPSTDGAFDFNLVLNESIFKSGSSQFKVDGDSAIVSGDLGTQSYIQVQNLINDYPNVNTLVLQDISGSVNDDINLYTGRLIRNAEMTTLVPADGAIYSGGVDLFVAGYKRIYTKGGKVGVHSWCCVNGKAADELSKDDPAHGAQLAFVSEMLGKELGPDFYFFTLKAAPQDSFHVMTQAELDKYLISK